MAPEVDVAIVNWNTSVDAVAAARAYSGSEGVVAHPVIFDNASEPGQRAILQEAEGISAVILSEENIGFGEAANEALRGGEAEFILVSNADVAPEPNAIREMIQAYDAATDCGLVGPVFEGTTNYHDELPGPGTLVIRLLYGNFNRKPVPNPAQDAVSEVGQVSGACFLTSRRLWESVGGFDERFFLWYEDVDLAKRLDTIGRRSLVVGSAKVKHLGGRSFVQLPNDEKQAIRLDSLSLYLLLHHRFVYLVSRPLAWIARLLRAPKTQKRD